MIVVRPDILLTLSTLAKSALARLQGTASALGVGGYPRVERTQDAAAAGIDQVHAAHPSARQDARVADASGKNLEALALNAECRRSHAGCA
jgi:hypothetical protein